MSPAAKRLRSLPSDRASDMINTTEFDQIVQELSDYDQQRETVILFCHRRSLKSYQIRG